MTADIPEPVTAETEDLKGFFEERAGILEHDAGLPRPEAELEAARITATLARNRGYLWASLRSALAGYPALPSQVPDRPGSVDALPLGTARVHVREGAKPGPVWAVLLSPRPSGGRTPFRGLVVLGSFIASSPLSATAHR